MQRTMDMSLAQAGIKAGGFTGKVPT
jgi:hypothetical protein